MDANSLLITWFNDTRLKRREKKSVMHVSTYTWNSMQLPSSPKQCDKDYIPKVKSNSNKYVKYRNSSIHTI